MKQVLVIKKYRDLINDAEIRDIGQALLLDDDRANELIAKGFVKEIAFIDLTTLAVVEDGKEKAETVEETKKKVAKA